jgi:hypothetical protein
VSPANARSVKKIPGDSHAENFPEETKNINMTNISVDGGASAAGATLLLTSQEMPTASALFDPAVVRTLNLTSGFT